MRTPIMVRVAQVVAVLIVLSIARSGVLLLRDQHASVMEASSALPLRVIRVITAVTFGIFVLVQTVRRGRYAHVYLVTFLGIALWLSLSTPHTVALLRVLVEGPEAYEEPAGLMFSYASREQLVGAAYTNIVVHGGAMCFLVALAFSKRVRTYFGSHEAVV